MADHRGRTLRVASHVRANLAGDLSLDALAEVGALSRFHFTRVWRAATGETPAETVRRERLNRAAVLVAMTSEPLARVARRCGFADADAMARAFRGAWGITPRAARARRLVPPALSLPAPMTPNRGDLPMPDPTIRQDPPAVLAALPHRGAYTGIGATFAGLGPRLGAAGIVPTGPSVAIYYDMPGVTPDDDLRAHAGVEVAPRAALPEGLDRIELPGGRVAVLLHRGPYQDIQATWEAAYRWLGASGEETGEAPPYERYLNLPGEVAPEDLETEVCVPLRATATG